MIAPQKQSAPHVPQPQGRQGAANIPAHTPGVPPPVSDTQRIELYYKVRDDLKEQISAADTRAIAILTLELAFVAGAAALVPLVAAHTPTPTPVRHRSPPPSTHIPLLVLRVGGAANVIIDVLFLVVLLLAVLWLVGSTLSIWLTMTDVLRAEFREPPMSKRKLLAIFTGGAFGQKALEGAPALDRNGAGLPFSPYAIGLSRDLATDMSALDIAKALIEDIGAKAAIARDKRLRLQEGTRSFTMQIAAIIIILGGSLILRYPY